MNTEEFKAALKNGVVVFEYEKKDGTKRIAKGTLNENLLPDNEPEQFELEKEGVDALISVKYSSMEEYTEKNGVELIGESEDGKKYVFRHKKKERARNDSVITYYDLEKDEFRSFKKDRFIGIVQVD